MRRKCGYRSKGSYIHHVEQLSTTLKPIRVMYIQVKNTAKKRNNQFRVQTMSAGLKEIKSRGWIVNDCKFEQLRDELVTNQYKELDGRMNKRGKQFAQRAGL
tara:strand:+ start:1023 stop:1328 length:306 start_codon:yes stop_codon:yes gene_type:complete